MPLNKWWAAVWVLAGMAIILVPLLTMILWNGFMPHVFGLPTIDFTQAMCLDLMLSPLALVELLKLRVED